MISALIGGPVLGALIGWFAKRKRVRAETTNLAASAVAELAGAMEDIIAPLRTEIRALHMRVAMLTKELRKHGIPVPD